MGLIADIHNDLEKGAVRLISEYRARLMSDAIKLCKDASGAEDLVSRTLVKVINKIDSYNDNYDFYVWMKTILVNIHRNDQDRPVTRGTIPVEDGALEQYAGADWSTDEEILRNSDCEFLHEVLKHLDPADRETLLMRYYDGLSLKEIASFLNKPVSTIGRRIQVAVRLLSGKFGAEMRRAKKPLAVLGVLLLGAATLFGAYQLVEEVEKVEEVGKVEKGGSGILSASEQDEQSVFVPARPEAEANGAAAVESISANEQKGTNEMKKVQVVKALSGAASAVTLAAAPLLAVAEEESKPYDAIVDYVQSTGTQCVDTGVQLGPTHTVVLKFARVDGSAIGQNVFGYVANASGRTFSIVFNDPGNGNLGLQILRNDFSHERIRLNLGKPTTEDLELKVGPDGCYLNGISMASGDLMMLTDFCAGNAHIFGVGVGWSSSYACNVVRVKACQIYDGATLVRDFRPVRKDGAGRLYDCVSKTLYATKGTGALAKGPDSAEQEFGELKLTKNVTVMNRRLKYIESTGVQAAAVDAKEGATTETKIKFSFPAPMPSANDSTYLYGYSPSGLGTDDRGFSVYRKGIDNQKECFALYRRDSNANRKEVKTDSAAHDPKEHVIVMRKGVFALDGLDYGPQMVDLTGDCAYSGCLFSLYANFGMSVGSGSFVAVSRGALHNGARDLVGCSARLYSFTMKRDGKEVRHLVPMQTAIGVGLWDTVENRFHPCISFSKDFIAGPPAPGLALIIR